MAFYIQHEGDYRGSYLSTDATTNVANVGWLYLNSTTTESLFTHWEICVFTPSNSAQQQFPGQTFYGIRNVGRSTTTDVGLNRDGSSGEGAGITWKLAGADVSSRVGVLQTIPGQANRSVIYFEENLTPDSNSATIVCYVLTVDNGSVCWRKRGSLTSAHLQANDYWTVAEIANGKSHYATIKLYYNFWDNLPLSTINSEVYLDEPGTAPISAFLPGEPTNQEGENRIFRGWIDDDNNVYGQYKSPKFYHYSSKTEAQNNPYKLYCNWKSEYYLYNVFTGAVMKKTDQDYDGYYYLEGTYKFQNAIKNWTFEADSNIKSDGLVINRYSGNNDNINLALMITDDSSLDSSSDFQIGFSEESNLILEASYRNNSYVLTHDYDNQITTNPRNVYYKIKPTDSTQCQEWKFINTKLADTTNNYRLRYELNGGSSDYFITSSYHPLRWDYKHFTLPSIKPDPPEYGLTLKGWTIGSNGTTCYPPGSTIENCFTSKNQSRVFYAVWEESSNSCAVTVTLYNDDKDVVDVLPGNGKFSNNDAFVDIIISTSFPVSISKRYHYLASWKGSAQFNGVNYDYSWNRSDNSDTFTIQIPINNGNVAFTNINMYPKWTPYTWKAKLQYYNTKTNKLTNSPEVQYQYLSSSAIASNEQVVTLNSSNESCTIPIQIEINDPTSTDQVLSNWNTKSNGSGSSYKKNDFVPITVSKPSSGSSNSSSITLYTIWIDGGYVYIYFDNKWQKAIPYIFDGKEWKVTQPYIFNGTEWKLTTS